MKKIFIEQVGITTNELAVMAGIYRFIETYGLPLDIIFTIMQERKQIPCWLSFYKEATYAGMKHKGILAKLSEPMIDVYGKQFTTHVLGKLNMYEGVLV